VSPAGPDAGGGCRGTITLRLAGRRGAPGRIGSGAFRLAAAAAAAVDVTVARARRPAFAARRRPPLLELAVRGTSGLDPGFPAPLGPRVALAFGERWRAHAGG
jgi:hypothetical protein